MSDDPIPASDFPSLRGVDESAYFVSILSPSLLDLTDVRPVIEIGAALLLDKPIVIVAIKGVKMPENLRRVAAKVIECDEPDHGIESMCPHMTEDLAAWLKAQEYFNARVPRPHK